MPTKEGIGPPKGRAALVGQELRLCCVLMMLVTCGDTRGAVPALMGALCVAGMEVYPSRTQLPELLPQPVLAGVIGGICFLSVAVIFSTMAACIMNRRRAARVRKRRQGTSWGGDRGQGTGQPGWGPSGCHRLLLITF